MIGHVYSGNPACAHCLAPMVELLSDAAGRLYGCKRCRTVDVNARPPAPRRWAHQSRILPRERRSLARFGRSPRGHGRRVPKWVTEERVEQTGYVVAPDRCAEAYGFRNAIPVADGWTAGLWERPAEPAAVLRWVEFGGDWGLQTGTNSHGTCVTRHASLRACRGEGVYLLAAEGAPEAAIAAAAMAIGGPDRLRAAWLRLRALTGA